MPKVDFSLLSRDELLQLREQSDMKGERGVGYRTFQFITALLDHIGGGYFFHQDLYDGWKESGELTREIKQNDYETLEEIFDPDRVKGWKK